MTLHPALAALAGKGYSAPLSPEKLDVLDSVDVIIWTTDVGRGGEDPGGPAREGR